MSYFLVSKRLSFREWSADDVPLAISLWGDPKVTALIGGPFSPEQARQRLHREIDLSASFRMQYWPVLLTSTHDFVGCCGLRPYGPKERVLELGFHVLSSQWGKGFATEAARAVIAHAFATFDANALFAGHHPNNVASERVLRRLGFRYTRHELYEPTGLMHPSYLLHPSDYISPKYSA